jgi:ubiquinone/menaquinone biosynthesis C-methylase UbiE
LSKENNENHDYYSFLSGKHWIADPIQALFMRGARKALFGMIVEHKPKSVLDVCCGTGGMAKRFTSVGIETTGVDSSQTMLHHAEKKKRITHAYLINASQMKFNEEFDAAYINLAIHEMSPDMRDLVWQKMCQSVRKGGVVAVMDLNLPKNNTKSSRFWRGFFELDERNFLRTNPKHYDNYCEFIKAGGVRSWMTKRVTKLEAERYYFSENIAVLSAII